MSIKDLLHWHRLQDKGDPSVTEESNSEDKQHHDHHVHSLEDGFSRRRFMRTAATAAGATGLVLGSGLSTHVLADHDDHDDKDKREDDRDGDADDAASPSPIRGGTPLLAPVSPEVFHFFFPPAPSNPGGAEPSLITDFNGFIGLAAVMGTGTGINTSTGATSPLFFDVDIRFMQGKYIGMCDHKEHTGTFALI